MRFAHLVFTVVLCAQSTQVSALSFATQCPEEDGPLLRYNVVQHGKEATFRSFVTIEYDPAALNVEGGFEDNVAAFKPVTEYVLLHCPTGKTVRVGGFSIVADPEAEALDTLSQQMFDLTESAFNRPTKFTMTELVGYFESAGFSASYKTGPVSSCACDM